ncbi:gametocyte-specific factor 1 homolog [Coccinella septempunctata]|uniref:gametocyte-specific factor 1 homolog n=1 Tax=Coccinella septempunctata TaxID=41139 RepID=UPI001D078A83|nr:gametocyte-specific factor 1 homolog [Coccinella septempunctata]
MQAFEDPETPMICPYDKNHTIYAARFAFHLTRCRKNHPGAPIAICDYNHEHRIPKPELQYHLQSCPDRLITEARKKDVVENDSVMHFPIKNLVAPVDEKWDDEELNHPGYNYEEHSEKSNVLRIMCVEKPSVRKQFRKDEQRRMNVLRAPNASNATVTRENEPSSSSRTPAESSSFHLDEDKPELSLADRINKDRDVYVPTNPEDEAFEFPKKTSRKNKKK